MEELFKQVESAATQGLWYPALLASLEIPDICGAMASPDGRATPGRYIAWFDRYVGPKYYIPEFTVFTGRDCWNLRCSMLHQGSTVKTTSRYERLVFRPKGGHLGAFPDIEVDGTKTSLLTLEIPAFCKDIVDGGTVWLTEVKETPEFKRNFEKFMQARPNGLPGLIGGWIIT